MQRILRYLKEIEAQRQTGLATEHSYRAALKALRTSAAWGYSRIFRRSPQRLRDRWVWQNYVIAKWREMCGPIAIGISQFFRVKCGRAQSPSAPF